MLDFFNLIKSLSNLLFPNRDYEINMLSIIAIYLKKCFF